MLANLKIICHSPNFTRIQCIKIVSIFFGPRNIGDDLFVGPRYIGNESSLIQSYLTVESLTVLQDSLIRIDFPLLIHRSVKQDWNHINVVYVNHLAPFRSQANIVYTLGKSFTIIHRVIYYIYKRLKYTKQSDKELNTS